VERQRTNAAEKRIARSDILPICMEAWYTAMTSVNITAAFRKSGIYPYDPTAYLQNKQTAEATQSPTCLSLIQAAIEQHPAIITESDTVPSVVRSLLPLLAPPQPDIAPAPDKCDHCGSNLKRKRRQQTLSTKAGLLLTDAELVQMIAEIDKDEADKKQKADERKAAAAEKKRLKTEKDMLKRLQRGHDDSAEDDENKENIAPAASQSSPSASDTHTHKRRKKQQQSDSSLTVVSQRQSSIVIPACPPVLVSIDIPRSTESRLMQRKMR
jgi:hypothetical protein